ncbi:GGDEF domain-containing protein [Gallaecimonas mangrovi]|uniref:GGDEF domain-containing protein n=1 Tax=Gallaecimonas mangrovi TaxID=2291597 RepID=UPI0018680018|nr:GGDEF domain-containing protein [Gallaecimonas mangrovi]
MHRQFPLVRFALSVTKPLALLSLASALLVLLSYPLGMEQIIRPVVTGPGSHPVTASCIILLSLAQLRSKHSYLALLLATLVALVSAARLFFDAHLPSDVVPFEQTLSRINQHGHAINFGVHSAFCLLMSALGLIAFNLFRPRLSQLLAMLGFAMPQVAMTGYAFGMSHFYGEMSLTTIMMVTPVTLAILLSSAHRGGIRAILSPWAGGKVARLQLFLSMGVPFLVGLLLIKTAERSPSVSFGLLIVVISQASALMIALSAILYEQMDRSRRASHRQLEQLATRDPLTGAYNRHALERRAEIELARSRRHGFPLSAVIIDADHFKRINDTFGHSVGDIVLQRLASLLSSNSRTQDLVARWGGEEFVLLLPDTNAENTLKVAEKMRDAVASTDFSDIAERLQVTISVGTAQLARNETMSELLRRADLALYQAKDEGRNCVKMAPAMVAIHSSHSKEVQQQLH